MRVPTTEEDMVPIQSTGSSGYFGLIWNYGRAAGITEDDRSMAALSYHSLRYVNCGTCLAAICSC